MSHELDPKVGRWYQRLDNEELFKVVSIDEDDGVIEIKTEDGELEELDAVEWVELDLEATEPPDDYVDPDDEDDDEEIEEEAAAEPETKERPAPGRPSRGGARETWDDDDDVDDEDLDDDDEDDDFDSDR